jgi:hypothetical protein
MGHTTVAAGQVSEDAPPGGIGQSGESSIQIACRIFNHLVKYCGKIPKGKLKLMRAPA